jgi:hypothetical protein
VDNSARLGTVTVSSPLPTQVESDSGNQTRTIMPSHDDDRYENALDDVIAQCGGDTRGALMALLAANEFLEAQLNDLHAAIETGEVPLRFEKVPANLLN